MHLTRKQIILIVSLSGVALLLLTGLILLMSCGSRRDPIPEEPSMPPLPDTPAPSDTPQPSLTPTPTETPTPTPSPTPYYLPLVPEGAAKTPTPSPTPSPTPASTPVPQAAAPRIHPNPREGIYNDTIREFLAIGTQNGEAVAVLLVHVEPPKASVVAIPCETLALVYTLGPDTTVTCVDPAPLMTATARAESAREGCWNLIWAVKNLTGYRAPAFLCVDFGCMEAFFSFAPNLSASGKTVDYAAFSVMLGQRGEERARSMALLGVGAAQFLGKVSLWDIPAFRNATSGAFSSSLSVFELLSLMRSMKEVREYAIAVLPTELIGGDRVLSDSAKLPF